MKRLFLLGPFGNSYNAKLDIINSTVVSKSTESDGDKKAVVNGDTVIDSADIVAVIKAMK